MKPTVKNVDNSDRAGDPGDESSSRQSAVETTRLHFRQLWELINKRIHSELNEPLGDKPDKELPPVIPSYPVVLKLLKFVPWGLLVLFITSLFITLEGHFLSIFGTLYPLENVLKIISVSGLIGFLTNRLAIAMLFRPVKRRPLLGQGLIPAQKNRIAYRLASAVSEDLINPELIKQRIHSSNAVTIYREQAVENLRRVIDDPGFRLELKQWAVSYVDAMVADPDVRAGIARKILLEMEHSLEERSLEKMAMKAYSYLRSNEIQSIIEKALTRIPGTVEQGLDSLDELMDQLPEKLNAHGETIETVATNLLYKLVNQLDVHELVEENLKIYSEDKLERLIRGASNEQLLYIQYLGGILGMIGGLVIWQPLLSLAGLTVVTLLILIIDRILLVFGDNS